MLDSAKEARGERGAEACDKLIAFLFVPITTLAYLTLKALENADASALFTMSRNVAGSIGISLAMAFIVERRQANMTQMSEHMTL